MWPGAQALQNLVTPLMLEGPGWEFAFWVWGVGILAFMYVFNRCVHRGGLCCLISDWLRAAAAAAAAAGLMLPPLQVWI